ncbi:MAG: hypothetical protein H0U56_15655 [Methylibium sp.]|nr:hypothetical protein [Methylibium sp.]
MRISVSLDSDLDVKKPDGARGATINDKGDPPAGVTIELNVDALEELVQLEQLRPYLRPKAKGATRDPLAIVHPNPNFWGINAVTVQRIQSPQPSAIEGWDLTIECIEWFPAAKPTNKNSSKNKTPKDDSSAWAGFADGIAGAQDYLRRLSPANTGAATANSGLPNRRAQ